MLSTDFESALFHANAINKGDDVPVIEFQIPKGNKHWEGYPYLWEEEKRNDKSSWFSLMKAIPKKFITKIHYVKYDNWLKQKSEGFEKGGETLPTNHTIKLYHSYLNKNGFDLKNINWDRGLFAITDPHWENYPQFKGKYNAFTPTEYGDKVVELIINKNAKIYTKYDQSEALKDLFGQTQEVKNLIDRVENPQKRQDYYDTDTIINKELRKRGYQMVRYTNTEGDGEGMEWGIIDPKIVLAFNFEPKMGQGGWLTKKYYHGTKSNLSSFDSKFYGKGEGSDMLGQGIYISTDIKKAREYGKKIYEVVLKSGTKLIDYDKIKWQDNYDKFLDKYKGEMAESKMNYARKYFDGVGYGSNTIIIFNPENLKISGQTKETGGLVNETNYFERNPNIRFEEGGEIVRFWADRIGDKWWVVAQADGYPRSDSHEKTGIEIKEHTDFYKNILGDAWNEKFDNKEDAGTVAESLSVHKMAIGGGIPERYKNKGFTRVGQKKKSTRPEKKWMVLARKGNKYKIVHGGEKGMEDFSQHHNKERQKRFWNRMGGFNSEKAKDPFSPLYWHKKFGTWEEGGVVEVDGEITTPDEQLIFVEPSVLSIMEELGKRGYKALIIGGAVRDALLGIEPKDIDVEVYKISYSDLSDFLAKFGKVDLVGKTFGVIKFTPRLGNMQYDFSIPRKENKIGVGHTEFQVTFDKNMTIAEASARRDFTFNAIAYDPIENKIYDYFGGVKDLGNKIIRHTSNAFVEDELRILRAMQFQARFDFTIAPETISLMREMLKTNDFDDLSKERIYEEWLKWASKGIKHDLIFKFMRDTGLINKYPELKLLKECPQDKIYHPEGDVEIHTTMTLFEMDKLISRDGISGEEKVILVMSILLHDISKPETTKKEMKRGRMTITSHGHEALGGEKSKVFLEKLGFPEHIITPVSNLVANHLSGVTISTIPSRSGKLKAVKKLSRRLYPTHINQLLYVMDADNLGRGGERKEATGRVEIVELSKEADVQNKPLKYILMGRHLIDLGLSPSPKFREILQKSYEAQENGEFNDIDGARQWLKDYIASNRI